jgi:flagellar biosynthesis protein
MDPRRLKAVALRYERDKDAAPRLVAKGTGEMARRIVERAAQSGVPLREDPGLAELLSALELEAEIPPVLYRSVAEVLAYIYRLNGAG